MKTLLLSVLALLALLSSACAQSTFYFSEGLAAGPFHQYGREAIYKDQLAYTLNANTLLSPKEGDPFSTADTKDITWKTLKADSLHRFRSREMGNGYLYLTYNAKKAQTALLNLTGNDMVYVNGVPHGGDIYRYGWMNIPVALKKGKNEFYVRIGRFGSYGGIVAKMDFPEKPVYLNTADLTMPHVVPTLKNDSLWVGLVVVNTSSQSLSGLTISIS